MPVHHRFKFYIWKHYFCSMDYMTRANTKQDTLLLWSPICDRRRMVSIPRLILTYDLSTIVLHVKKKPFCHIDYVPKITIRRDMLLLGSIICGTSKRSETLSTDSDQGCLQLKNTKNVMTTWGNSAKNFEIPTREISCEPPSYVTDHIFFPADSGFWVFRGKI